MSINSIAQIGKDYNNLEQEFLEQVKKDNKSGFPHAHLVRNFVPKSKVDFILIAMEPSLAGNKSHEPAECRGIDGKAKNFAHSVEDFILHFCIREYLCKDGRSHHLTDLAKGAMQVTQAQPKQWERWERWLHLLREEIRLVGPKAHVISIGGRVQDFLRAKSVENYVGSIIHYSKNVSGARKVVPERYPEAFEELSRTVSMCDIERTVREVLADEPDAPCVDKVLKRLRSGSGLTRSRKKLMFTYKVKFERFLREYADRSAP